MGSVCVCKMCSLRNSNIQLNVKPRDMCLNCDGLKSELYKAQLEILSYEKVIQVLREELDNINIINEQQFGFRKRFSTEDAIFKLTHEVLNALNNNTMVGSTFYDLEKAFDSVNHSLLIKKTSLLRYNGQS
jgi:hypothetical protein